MKAWLLIVSCLTTVSLCGQEVKFSLGAGVYKSYIVESFQNPFTTFGPGVGVSGSLLYQKSNEWAIGLDFSEISTSVDFGGVGNGQFRAHNLLVKAIHTYDITEKFYAGWGVGLGMTREHSQQFLWTSDERTFSTIMVQGVFGYDLGKHIGVVLFPSTFWYDPINTFKPRNWVTGGEDINIGANLQFQFKF